MKTAIGSYEAKTKLPELLRQVKAGKSFTITNRGEAIADLVPSAGAKVKDKRAAAAKLKVPIHVIGFVDVATTPAPDGATSTRGSIARRWAKDRLDELVAVGELRPRQLGDDALVFR